MTSVFRLRSSVVSFSYRRSSTTTSTSHGRSVPFFLLSDVFLPFMSPPLAYQTPDDRGPSTEDRQADASSRVASRASATSPASKLDLWQFGACMSPSSLCAATVQPPAHTGM